MFVIDVIRSVLEKVVRDAVPSYRRHEYNEHIDLWIALE